MNGIEILSKTPIETLSAEAFVAIVILSIFGIIMCLSEFYLSSAITIIVAISIFFCCQTPTGRYEYECKINDKVSVVKFYEKYEIKDHYDNVWIIRDKKK